MNKIKMLIIILVVICIATHCENDDCHQTIELNNQSNCTLYIDGGIWDHNDTLLDIHHAITMNIINANPNNVIADATKKNIWFRSCIESIFYGFLRLYVYDIETLANYSWDTICTNYMVLQRYDLTVSDLQRLNWTITYPPDERMKNVKMYPPYQE